MTRENRSTRRGATRTGARCTTKHNNDNSTTADAVFMLVCLFLLLSLPIAMGAAKLGGWY